MYFDWELNNFSGSTEEVTAKQVLRSIITQIHFPAPTFVNLVIKDSNAAEGTPFSEAPVYLQLSHESREAFRTRYQNGYPKCGMVYMKDILDKSLLHEFVEHGVAAVTKQADYANGEAFLTLLRFLKEQENHECALHELFTVILSKSGNKESVILAGLAKHLFSQLAPGERYAVDRYAKQFPDRCGCRCKAAIGKGNTSVGSQTTWHGRLDILLDDTIAVAVHGKKEGAKEAEQRKGESESKSCNISEEVKTTNKHEGSLLDSRVLKQILAEAITNGFAQVNRIGHKHSQFCIPTFGATPEHVTVCLYDSENDCLLHIKEQLDLWCPDEMVCYSQLNVTTIVIIWLFINFTLFTQKNLCSVLGLDKTGLHDELKECLKYYRKATVGGNFDSQTPVVPPWKYVTPVPKTRNTQD